MKRSTETRGRCRFALVAISALLAVGGAASEVSANGTEMLGPPVGLELASGSDLIIAGVGLREVQPGTINITIPDGVEVKQVILYWEGHENTETGQGPTDTITVNPGALQVTGDRIGGPTLFFTIPQPGWDSAYRQDITNLGLITNGPNSIQVSGLNFNVANNGAGIIVVVDDGNTADLQLADGDDVAFINFPPPRNTTAPVTFAFDPVDFDRTAQLDMFVGSVALEGPGGTFGRPTIIRVTTIAGIQDFNDVLANDDGPEWDSPELEVLVPAGASSLTVQVLSQDSGLGEFAGNLPASLTWVACGFSLPLPQNTGACCLTSGTCISDLTEAACLAQGGVWAGPDTACTAPQACCIPGAACSLVDPLCCELLFNGTPQGPNTDCQPAACCLPDDNCEVLDICQCIAAGGTLLPGAVCMPNPCAPEGACCLSDGACVPGLTEQRCLNQGGVWAGPSTVCTAPEACCIPGATCSVLDPLCCQVLFNGTPQGPGTNCTPAACCLPDDNCEVLDICQCIAAGGTLLPGVLCTPNPCAPEGACCLSDGACVPGLTEQRCLNQGGVWAGPSTVCTAPEACCIPGATCSVLDPLCCQVLFNGTPQGPGTNCTPAACCLPDDNCEVLDICQCIAAGGTLLPGVLCTPNPCAPEGACCLSDGACVPGLTEQRCLNQGGVWAGPSTVCTAPEACCIPGATCSVLDPLCCQVLFNGTPQGPGTNCTPAACCLPDDNCEVLDICQCIAAGGTLLPGAVCTPNPCAPEGACCLSDGACVPGLTEQRCLNQGGVWAGPDTACTAPQACCIPGAACSLVDPLCCELLFNGTPQGPNTDCQPAACCLPDDNCEVLDICQCIAAGGTLLPGAVCTPNPCAPEGACCLSDGACVPGLTEQRCLNQGGVWAGPDTACTAPQACCIPGAACSLVDPLCCELLFNGTPQGPNTDCQPAACCLPDDNCEVLDICQCIAAGGTLLPGAVCTPNPCAPEGACCLSDGACVPGLTEQRCLNQGGVWAGPSTLCTAPEACCIPGATCSVLDPLCCQVLFNGTPQGPGTNCTPAACCLPDDNCEVLDICQCIAAGGTLLPGVLCMPNPCAPEGACCLSDGACVPGLTEQRCLNQGGVWAGPSTVCTAPQACCIPGATCSVLDPLCCQVLFNGTPQGPGTNCTPAACCLPDDNCEVLDICQCIAAGGTLLPGVLCTPNPCAPEGACCLSDGACVPGLTEQRCLNQGGVWAGPSTVCTAPEACCIPGATCSLLDPLCCEVLFNGTPQGPGTNCTPVACCLPDDNCEVLDICQCTAAGGTLLPGVLCTPNPCAPEGACCLTSGPCLSDLTEQRCLNQGGVWAGPGTVCTAPEACCLPNAGCAVVDPLCCELLFNGTPQGPNTNCQPAACCLPDDNCEELDICQCIQSGGTPLAGTLCTPNPCAPEGACCLTSGLCLSGLTEQRCLNQGGMWAGPGTVCTAPEACCLDGGACSLFDPLCCGLILGGTPQGAGTTCFDPDIDCPPVGACCLRDGSCIEVTERDCADQAGSFIGINTLCATADCPIPLGACCISDKEGDVCVDGLTLEECENPATGYPGTYQGDGTFCLGDANGDEEDDLCFPPSEGPINDDCVDRIEIFNGLTPFSTINATTDGPTPFCASGPLGSDIWYNYVASFTGTLVISTCNSNFDTVIAVYGGCDVDNCVDNLTIRACNDNAPGCSGVASALTLNVVAGKCYKIQLGGIDGEQGVGTILLSKTQDNDLCFNREPIYEGLTEFDTTGAGTDGPPLPAVCDLGPFGDDQIYNDIWFNYLASCDGELTVTTCEELGGSATFDTRLAVYAGIDCPPTECLGANDDDPVNPCGSAAGGFHSTVTVPVIGGESYKIRVGGFAEGQNGPGALNLTLEPDDPDVATLLLETDLRTGYAPGERVEVTLSMVGLCGSPAAGFQAFLEFDDQELEYNSATYTPDPFGDVFIGDPFVLQGANQLDLAAGIISGVQGPTSADALLVTLNFTALVDGCVPTVGFRDNVPPSTLTDVNGSAIVPLELVGLPDIPSCLGDTNGDDVVDTLDLIKVITEWGGDNCTADVDGLSDPQFGAVNVFDLIIVINQWGPCP